MTDVLVAPPAVEPVTRTQSKLHLRVTSTSEDTLIDALITAARGWVESYCRRALVLQTRRLVLDYFPPCIEVQRSPLRAVSEIAYLDTAGTLQTLDASHYRVDAQSERGRITPAYGETWPATQMVSNAVTVTYTAGHLLPFTADAASDVLTAAGHGFADGDITPAATLDGALPGGLAAATPYYVRDATADTLKLAATAAGAAIDITSAGTAPNVLGLLPEEIRAAMLLLIGHWYENREAINIGNITTSLPFTIDALLMPHRVVRF